MLGWARPKLNQVSALVAVAALQLPLPIGAQSLYQLNGIPAPQVRPNPLAARLQTELSSLQAKVALRTKRVSLSEAMEAGLLNNPRLADAYAQIQGSQWSLVAVRRQWYPSLNASTGNNGFLVGQSFGTTTTRDSNSSTLTTFQNATGVGIGLNLNWSFFAPSRGPSINAAGATLQQQQLLFDVSARNLVLEIQQAYFNLQEQANLIRSYEEILAGTEKQVRLTEAQFNNGLVSISDVEQIRTQQYSTLSILISTYRAMFDAAAGLAEAMALPEGTLAMPAEPLSAVGSWSESLDTTLREAQRLREEIQASLAASTSATWRATSLFNQYWPQFSVGVFGGYGGSNTTRGFPGNSTTLSNQNQSWSGGVGLGFSWQFFDGGINAAQAEASKAQARQLKDQAALQRLRINREVEQAYNAYISSKLGMESTNAQAMSARNAAVAAQQRFNVGVTDMATLVQTLNQAIQAAADYATAIRTYNNAVAQLYRSSAHWPADTQPLVQQRVNTLRLR
mgnify:CR=1 FL=1